MAAGDPRQGTFSVAAYEGWPNPYVDIVPAEGEHIWIASIQRDTGGEHFLWGLVDTSTSQVLYGGGYSNDTICTNNGKGWHIKDTLRLRIYNAVASAVRFTWQGIVLPSSGVGSVVGVVSTADPFTVRPSEGEVWAITTIYIHYYNTVVRKTTGETDTGSSEGATPTLPIIVTYDSYLYGSGSGGSICGWSGVILKAAS